MRTGLRHLHRRPVAVAALLAALLAAWQAAAAAAVEFTQETLDNGLRVIYAPLRQAPVVHVRVLYYVGSRDERPDRQGFAHMFEHMMFRGSAHVKPEEHMKLIGTVGGRANAFTSFDQTVYVNTLPSSQLELALYLEADRMASFRVSDEIYRTERNVVTEEWRIRQNRPYGTLWEDFCKAVFVRHSYQWTPIGNMNHLRAAQAAELQEFFNRYYVPNNAVLVIAGDIDVEAARALVRRYFAWVPRGEDVRRDIPTEPEPTQARRREVNYRVPLAKVMIGYPAAPHQSDDNCPLSLLATILGGGRSARLDRALVHGPEPLCVDAGASNWALADAGVFVLSATVLAGRDADQVEQALAEAVADVREKGVAPKELDKAKTLARVRLIRRRETATGIAAELGTEALIGDDAERVNRRLAEIDAATVDDVKAAAARYLRLARATTLRVVPDPAASPAPEQLAEDQPTTRPIVPRDVTFPDGYAAHPPIAGEQPNPVFEKGTESAVGGVRVIVMPDSRLPLVNWSLTMRRGSDSEPADRVGLADLTASLVRRGTADRSFDQLNEDLESRGVRIEVSSGGDFTRLDGSCTADHLGYAMEMSRKVLREPAFSAEEFAKRREQLLNQIRLAQEDPRSVAQADLAEALFGATPLGRHETPETVGRITLDDVKAFYRAAYRPNGALFVISGDVTVEGGRTLAKGLLSDWPPAPLAEVDYALPEAPSRRTIILVDRPEGRQSTLRMGLRAYDVHSDDKFRGALANRILTHGIDSRLGRYVRAEKGLAYSVWGLFRPGRHGGTFVAGTDTKLASTAEAVEAMFEVFDGMRDADVTDAELSEAKLAVAGSMVMGMQTMGQQAGQRVEGILNGYPADYYDRYPARVGQVTKGEVREVMRRFVRPDRMVIVVVAPAEAVKQQLEPLGEVKVIPMPVRRRPRASDPAALKPAA